MELEAQRAQFEKWCGITITDESKAPKATALKRAYWTAWQAGYAAGAAAENEAIILLANLRRDEITAELLQAIRARQEQGREKP